MHTILHFRAARTGAALAVFAAAAALALGAAGPARALTCPPGTALVVAGNGAEFCAVSSTGGVPGGGGVSVGSGGSTVPGGAAPIVGGGGGGGSVPGYQAPAAPAPAPYVPAVQAPYVAPAPVYGPAPVQAYVPPAPAPVTNQPVKGFAPTENPVIDGIPAEAPAPVAAPTETPAAVTTSATVSATPSATPSPSTTPSAEPIQGTQASNTMRPAPFIVGVLAVLVVGVAAWYWRRTRKTAAER